MVHRSICQGYITIYNKRLIIIGRIEIVRWFLGFNTKQEVCLHNLSTIPVKYSITVLNDGSEEPLTYEDFANSDAKLSFPSNPREFLIQPNEGVVPKRSFLKIRVKRIIEYKFSKKKEKHDIVLIGS